MARMFNLADIFEEIVDRFDDGTLAEKDFVSQIHEFVLHVFAELGDELNAVGVEFGEQRRGNVAPVGENLAEHLPCVTNVNDSSHELI